MFQQGHIEIRPAGIGQNISAGSPEGQPGWCHKSPRIVKQGSQSGYRNVHHARARIAHQVRIRGSSGKAVAHAGVVGRNRTKSEVVNAEWRAALYRRNARPLPTSQKPVAPPGLLEEGEIVHPREVKSMPLIEVGAGPIGIQIIRVNEPGIVVVGRVVNRVAVGIGQAQLQSTDTVAHGYLKPTVVG